VPAQPVVNRDSKRAKYLRTAYAASYAMQARSAGHSVMAWGEGVARWLREKTGSGDKDENPRRVQSFLGGAFLRMYLDGKVDPDTVAAAGKEIGESKEFSLFTANLQAHLRTMVRTQRLHDIRLDQLRVAADRYLDAKKIRDGIAFRNTLNAVIGGVTGVDVEKVELLEERLSDDGTDRKYRIGIIFYDTYDFANKRSGEYDRYRKKLAVLLIAEKFDEFEQAFYPEANPFSDTHQTKLDDAAVFASFMYALEKKGWTPGALSWQVTVPTEIMLHFTAAMNKAVKKP